MAISLLQRLFVSNESDEVVSNEEPEVTTTNNGQETQTQMTLAQKLYAFVADDKNKEQCNNVNSRVVQKETMLYEITKRRPKNLEKLYAALKTIKPTSVEAERAFSALGYFVSKSRNCLNDDTIDALLFLRHYYSKQTLFILQYNRLLYYFVNLEKSRDYVMDIPGKSLARDFSFSPEIPTLFTTIGALFFRIFFKKMINFL